MDQHELLKLLNLNAKPTPLPDSSPATPTTATTPANPSVMASPTALEVDEWMLRRGRDLIAESERLQQTGTDEFAAADFFTAAFELQPQLHDNCVDAGRHQFIAQLLETPEYHSLHADTQLDDTASAIEYVLETMLTLDKQTGSVSCELPGLATLAQEELGRCIAVRTGSDITRIIQKLFEQQADLFPIRPQGGCYFVAARHVDFVNQIQDLLNRVGGRLLRFPVPTGTAEGDRSVTQAVADGLAAVVAEHRAAVAQFGRDTRDDTLQRAAEKIRTTKFKLTAYAEYLAGERERLDQAVAEAEHELRVKVEQIASSPVAAS